MLSSAEFVIKQMNNRFCANIGNTNKKIWNTKHENTRALYNQVILGECNFLRVCYEFIPPDSNENAIDVAKLCIKNKGYNHMSIMKTESRLSTASNASSCDEECQEVNSDDGYNIEIHLNTKPPLLKNEKIEF